MQRRLKWIFLGLGLCLVCWILLPALMGGRQLSFRIKAQHEWIQKAVQELDRAMPATSLQDTNADFAWWNIPRQNSNAIISRREPRCLVFSNGWAAYCLHTIHDDPAVGDTSVLRTSDGDYYLSGCHFCLGLPIMYQVPQPANVQEFLAQYGQAQGWTLFATQAEGTWCVVSCPEGGSKRTRNKRLWVWISSGNGTNRTTLFEQRHTIAGSYISWSARWPSNECCVVDIYDYGRDRSAREYPESLRSNHLASFTYRLDQPTRKFVEQK